MPEIKNPLAYINYLKPTHWPKLAVGILTAGALRTDARPLDTFGPAPAPAGALTPATARPPVPAARCATYQPIHRVAVQTAFWELDYSLDSPLVQPAGVPALTSSVAQKLAVHVALLNDLGSGLGGVCGGVATADQFITVLDQALADVSQDPAACRGRSDAKQLLQPYLAANLSDATKRVSNSLLQRFFRPSDANRDAICGPF